MLLFSSAMKMSNLYVPVIFSYLVKHGEQNLTLRIKCNKERNLKRQIQYMDGPISTGFTGNGVTGSRAERERRAHSFSRVAFGTLALC